MIVIYNTRGIRREITATAFDRRKNETIAWVLAARLAASWTRIKKYMMSTHPHFLRLALLGIRMFFKMHVFIRSGAVLLSRYG